MFREDVLLDFNMKDKKTVEPQYEELFSVLDKFGRSTFGIMANQSWNEDPRRTLFTLSRYKFVSKMFVGKKHALEIGCADAFGTRLVQQTVSKVTASDIDPLFIQDAEDRKSSHWPLNLIIHDFLKNPLNKYIFDCAYCLDVLEHINKKDEDNFINNIKLSLAPQSPIIFGMPSIESQAYASKQSKIGHINCKSGEELKETLDKHFGNVFIFSMNDEVIHTGFLRMANYILAVAI
jgi:2-polyprenyl-3-methyl-5-hydroxy-6-metoxy-1,4-benzoquinol methylase